MRSVFPAGWWNHLSHSSVWSGGEDEVFLASILLYGIYRHHGAASHLGAARHSNTPAHIESMASIAWLIGEPSVHRQVSLLWWGYFKFQYGGDAVAVDPLSSSENACCRLGTMSVSHDALAPFACYSRMGSA
jgi:hypothetical protein